jgi:hypothetical protein
MLLPDPMFSSLALSFLTRTGVEQRPKAVAIITKLRTLYELGANYIFCGFRL